MCCSSPFQAFPAKAQEQPHRFTDLWLTPDQQGRIAFDRGDFATAAKRFADPMWRGIAAYRALDFLEAAQEFRKVETVEGRFALGNAEAQNHAWERSIKAYDEVLKAQPGLVAAKANRAIVVALFEAQEEKRRKQEKDDSAPPDQTADEMRVDPKQKGGKRIQVTPQDVTTAGAAEAWMRAAADDACGFPQNEILRYRPRQMCQAREGGNEALARLGNPCSLLHRAAWPGRSKLRHLSRCREDVTIDLLTRRGRAKDNAADRRARAGLRDLSAGTAGLPGSQRGDAAIAGASISPNSATARATPGVRFEFAIYPQEPGSFAISDQQVKSEVRRQNRPRYARKALCAAARDL